MRRRLSGGPAEHRRESVEHDERFHGPHPTRRWSARRSRPSFWKACSSSPLRPARSPPCSIKSHWPPSSSPRRVRRAGLADVLGYTGDENVQGERVQKLDVIANETLIASLRRRGSLRGLGSEELVDPVFSATRRAATWWCRSARRLEQHRRQHLDRHDLRHPSLRPHPPAHRQCRVSARRPRARCSGLRDLRVLDRAGAHHRKGCARLHVGSERGRVLPVAREHPLPRKRQHLLDQRRQQRVLHRGGQALERLDQSSRTKQTRGLTRTAMSVRSSPTRIAR